MNKKLLIGAGAAVVLAVVAYIGVIFFVGSIVRAGVVHFGPMLTQTPVGLEEADLSPLSGSGTLSGLSVGNPAGWSSGQAFSLGRIHIDVAPSSIFTDRIVVNELTIDQPEVVYETRFVSSNIGDLVHNIENAGSSGGASAEATAKSGQPLRFEVKRFRLINGKVTVGVGPTAITLPMPPVTLDNLGSGGQGITSSELALAIVRSVMTSVVSSTTHALGKVGSTMGSDAGSALKNAGGQLKSLFGGQH